MDLEDADKSINRIIDTARVSLAEHREAGYSDEDFVLRLLAEFVALRKHMSPDAGSLHMALSVYRLALLTDYAVELEEKVAFHKAGIEFLLQLDDFESI
jgi:hypothetical protein